MTVRDLVATLDDWFPRELAEPWDNTGLLLGDPSRPVRRVLTCLTLTAEVAAEASAKRADLIITHHPIFFRPIQRFVADGPAGFLFGLAGAGIAVHSPHTRFDGARLGINEQLAQLLGVVDPQPIRPLALTSPARPDASVIGAGRVGELRSPTTLGRFAKLAATSLGLASVQLVGRDERQVTRVAVACGAAGEFLEDAIRLGVDVFVTGELRYHDALRAESAGVGLVLPGHHATERFACERLAERIASEFPSLIAWSADEKDPVRTIVVN
jgi:dinuclear metal center YbgI/SA1388 family protein